MTFLEGIQEILDKSQKIIIEKKLSTKEKKALPKKSFALPKEHAKVADNKNHFPINDESHARNALARANQYKKSPRWFKGNLDQLKKIVADSVKKKFSDIDVTEKSYK